MTHTFVSKINRIGYVNDVSPDRRQAIVWTSAYLL